MFDKSKAIYSGDTVIYPEHEIDLFDVMAISDIPVDQNIKYHDVKPYSEVSYVVLDIETTGVDPLNHSIYMIGLKNEKGVYKILSGKNEFSLLREFYSIINKKKPDYCFFYNGFGFDLDFIYKRSLNYMAVPGLSPVRWFVENNTHRTFRAARVFGKPVNYMPYKFFGESYSTNMIDLYHQILAWDEVHRKLGHSKTLKNAVIDYGLRKEKRLELSYEEMMERYNRWDEEAISDIEKYCKYDLDDTELLANMIVPSIHYQQKVLDLTPEQLSTYGTGYKWNYICTKHYDGYLVNQPDPKKSYKGAYTFANSGIYKHAGQIDISSAYPMSQIKNYAYDTDKDPEGVVLKYLVKLTLDRLHYKKLGKTDVDYQRLADSFKVIINSGYGFYGTEHLDFNSMAVASFIAAYVSKLTKFISSRIQYYGGDVVQVDTDGIIFYSKGEVSPEEIHKKTQSDLPTDFEIGLDWVSDLVYVPMNENGDSLKKNYLVYKDRKIVKKKGLVNNRSRAKYESEFLIKYVEILGYDGKLAAKEYANSVISDINKGRYPIEKLMVTKTIPKNDKKFTETLMLAEKGEKIISYYMGSDSKGKPIEVTSGPVNAMFYVTSVKKIMSLVNSAYRVSNY